MLDHEQQDQNDTRSQVGSFAIVPLWLIQRGPSRAALYVYVALAAIYADRGTGMAWPSVNRLAADTGLSRSAVIRAKNELREMAAIRTESRRRDDGGQTSDIVTVVQADPRATSATPPVASALHHEQEPVNYRVSSTEETSVEQGGQQQLLDGEASTPRRPAKPDAVVYITEVFDHWREVMGKQGTVLLNEKRRSAIGARLREGYSVEDLKRAVDGCAKTPHNMGKNDRGLRYDDVELICRNGANVERFRDTAAAPGSVKRDRHRLGQTTIDDDAVFAKGKAAINGGR